MAFRQQKPAKPLTPDEILAKIEGFCAYRERCLQEVHAKLAELGADVTTTREILTVLEGDGYVNEARFAEAYAGGKFRVNHWGKVRIRIELKRRNIPGDLIRNALDQINEQDYLDLLTRLIEQKKAQYEGDPQARDKTIAYLLRSGFEQELIFRHL